MIGTHSVSGDVWKRETRTDLQAHRRQSSIGSLSVIYKTGKISGFPGFFRRTILRDFLTLVEVGGDIWVRQGPPFFAHQCVVPGPKSVVLGTQVRELQR